MKTLKCFILINLITLTALSQVLEQWAARFNGPANAQDFARKVCVDNSGNIIVTGNTAVSTNDYQYATVKYNFSGSVQWIAYYNGPLGFSNDYATGLATDASGNIYVTGISPSASGSPDFYTIKYNSIGVQQWFARFGDVYGGSSQPEVAVDASGNVYVTGGARNGGTDLDYVTIKYNNSGIQQWALRYGNTSVPDAAAMIKLDQQGNILITGSSHNGNNNDYATIKYTPLGLVDWVQRYNAPGNGDDYSSSLAVDNSGNVYVAGYSTGSGTGIDYAALKYASNGAQQWVSRYSSPGVFNEYANSLALDNSGNIYITGSGSTSTNSGDYLTVKLNNSGTYQWAVRYNNGMPSGYHSAYHIICDPYGYLYVTGASSGGSTDYATVKYDPVNGDTVWTKRYDGPAAGYDQTFFMSIDNSGNVYVTGYSAGFGTMTDYATVKYVQAPNAPSGLTAIGVTNNQINLNWSDNSNNEVRYLIERSTNAGGNWLLRDSVNANITAYSDMGLLQNTVYHYRVRTYNSVGYTAYSNTSFDTTLNVTGITSNGEIPIEFRLEQNYPNPFNPVTKIKFDIPQSLQNVKLAVYDLLGRQVAMLVDQQLQAGKYEVELDGNRLSSGTYFYRLKAGSFTEIKKMILIK